MFIKEGSAKRILYILVGVIFAQYSYADNSTIPLIIGKAASGGMEYHLNLKAILFLSLLTVVPALLITTTSFTRIVIVFSILRQALGIPNVPGNQVILGLSLIMTIYVMMPVFNTIHKENIQSYLAGSITEEVALTRSAEHLKQFMLKQTRKTDLELFINFSKTKIFNEEYPFYLVMPAFIISELKSAFQIGFLIFLPFLIIDLVTASVLMSMGMMMLSPMVISLPFKLMFFVMVNGWNLMTASLINSFR